MMRAGGAWRLGRAAWGVGTEQAPGVSTSSEFVSKFECWFGQLQQFTASYRRHCFWARATPVLHSSSWSSWELFSAQYSRQRRSAAAFGTDSIRRYAAVPTQQRVIRTQGLGGETLKADLLHALVGMKNYDEEKSGSGRGKLAKGSKRQRKKWQPKFVLAVLSNYGTDITQGALSQAVKESELDCPIIGCQARNIREIRRRPNHSNSANANANANGGRRTKNPPSVTCWSLYDTEADNVSETFAFWQKHVSLPDLTRWSNVPLQQAVLQKEKQPFTFTFSSEDFPIEQLTQRNANIFDNRLHCGVIPRGPVSDLFFVANAVNHHHQTSPNTTEKGKGKGKGRVGDSSLGDSSSMNHDERACDDDREEKRMCIASRKGIAGLGIVGNFKKDDWTNLMRKVLSEHWYKDVSGCERSCRGLFVPSKSKLQQVGKPSSQRAYQKYFIAKEARGIPMFPINGACLFPAATMRLRIFEPRYKAMVKQCIENKEVFGFIPRGDTTNRFVDTIGTIAYIKEIVDMSPYGESTIVIKGLRRFKFKKGRSALRIQPGSFGLDYADVKFYDDKSEEEANKESLTYAIKRFKSYERFNLRERAQKLLGDMYITKRFHGESVESELELFEGEGDELQMTDHDMSFILADFVPAPPDVKIRWLKSMSTTDRLSETMDFFEAMLNNTLKLSSSSSVDFQTKNGGAGGNEE